jgi:hypothetical protein
MPLIDFSSPPWSTAQQNSTEFCPGPGGGPVGPVTPELGVFIGVERGTGKVVGIGIGPDSNPALNIALVDCNTNTPLDGATLIIRFTNPAGFVRFEFVRDRAGAGPLTVTFFANEGRSGRVGEPRMIPFRDPEAVDAIEYSDLCRPIREVVIETSSAGFLDNVRFEAGLPFGGRVLFLTDIYCMIVRGFAWIARQFRRT